MSLMDATEAKNDRRREIDDWTRVVDDTRRKNAEKEEDRAKPEAKRRLEKVRKQDGGRVSAERLRLLEDKISELSELLDVGLESLEGRWAFDSETRRRLEWSSAESGEISYGASESQSTYCTYICVQHWSKFLIIRVV